MSESALQTQGALVFYGNDGAEAEEFIRSVIRITKAAGRFRDNDWIIEEVAAALAEDALRWYIELDDEIQNDWKLLRRAILQKYPPPNRRTPLDANTTAQVVSGALPIVPTPAAAAPPVASVLLSQGPQRVSVLIDTTISSGALPIVPTLAAAAPPVASVPLSQGPRNVFRIKISLIKGGIASFLGMKNGKIINAFSLSEALTVKHCQQTRELRVIDKGYETGEKLAVRNTDSRGIPTFGKLGLVGDRGHSRSGSPVSSRISITAWNVGADNILNPTHPSPVEFYLPSGSGQQYQTILACLNPQANIVYIPMVPFLNLELEEV